MILVPRDYQIEGVGSIYRYFEKNKVGNPLVAMPTGTGKSVVIAMFIESIFKQYQGQRILNLTHVKELIQQNYLKLLELWPNAPAGINSAGLGRNDTLHPIIFAGIATVAKRAYEFGHIDLIIIDEAHLVSPAEHTMYQKLIADLTKINKHIRVVGFTATPWRLGLGSIMEGGIFTDTCFDITGMGAFNRLIAEGYLSPLIPALTRTLLDVTGVHMRGGEFIEAELQKAVDRDEITEAAIREALERGHDRKHWLIFCAGVNHAISAARILSEIGFPCGVVHSNMTPTERDAVILDFKEGRIRAIANNNVLTTGFDMPGIDLIIMLRPTQSAILWIQMLGRGTRPCPWEGKINCLVLDFGGNSARLGPINDPVIPRKKGEKKGTAPIKLCGSCDMYNHISARYCGGKPEASPEGCGAEFTFDNKLNLVASSNQLIKGDLPITEVFRVDHITYARHIKQGAPDSLKVSYYCNLKVFTDYICLQHAYGEFANRKARVWWRERSDLNVPVTVLEALEVTDKLLPTTHIRVWVNKKHPEIMARCLDGTAFGQETPTGELPTVATNLPKEPVQVEIAVKTKGYEFEEDDIPF